MDANKLREFLELAAKSDDSHYEMEDVAGALSHGKVPATPDLVEEVLRFMEAHPDLDYGNPGGLVRFMMSSGEEVYAPLLLASLQRRPMPDTISMLYGLVVTSEDVKVRADRLEALRACAKHPQAGEGEQERVEFYLEALGKLTSSPGRRGSPKGKRR